MRLCQRVTQLAIQQWNGCSEEILQCQSHLRVARWQRSSQREVLLKVPVVEINLIAKRDKTNPSRLCLLTEQRAAKQRDVVSLLNQIASDSQ
ncbi:hypothetical protein PEC302107_40700 [Pectobacterium araliae]|uniref:Uncharacterized protein n=1 Tax=Pectobacterium araliae TaxID=3073862 RepID=A0AAN0KC98_9GAMM|nr:hypothetical protein PEC302110_29770 [Pectobacterium sp. MAFF 302110]GKW22341.1 hypothetical protein PEC302107_40700 [Pectobacterium carotovorum subsp. carotovorum]